MRNQMHSFAATPDANIPRSRFNMPCNVKFTGNTGKLIPFYVCEVLPGDTFEVSTSLVCRLQTLIHPLMDNMYLDTYFFFVPNRLVWDNWKHFCGEPNKAWVPDREWTVPKINLAFIPGNGWTGEDNEAKYKDFLKNGFKDSIVDYMGIGFNPVIDYAATSWRNYAINALPIRAYNKIYDDWFRDENLIDPINLYTGDSNQAMVNKASWQEPLYGGKPYNAPKLHDYFTSALPEAQRGDPVSLAAGITADRYVNTIKTRNVDAYKMPGLSILSNKTGNNSNVTTYELQPVSGNTPKALNVIDGNPESDTGIFTIRPDNLAFNLSGYNLGITINDLRMAFQVQKFMERSARGGARYIELIKSMFGVTSPDARLQRSEYLGGHRVPINIHQVVNQSESVDSSLGNTAAFSVTSDVHNDFIHSFTEHGFVIGICTVRYKHTYPQGMNRMWSRTTKFDYYWPVFANIGEQPIKNKEIFFNQDGVVADQVFGYQEAWADYRYMPNRVMGEMRPGIPSTLASWHLADFYEDQPILSQDWIEEDLAPVDRAIAVTSSVADQFLFDVLINNNATRPMPLYSVPGLVDHF